MKKKTVKKTHVSKDSTILKKTANFTFDPGAETLPKSLGLTDARKDEISSEIEQILQGNTSGGEQMKSIFVKYNDNELAWALLETQAAETANIGIGSEDDNTDSLEEEMAKEEQDDEN